MNFTGKVHTGLADFIEMGSEDKPFDENVAKTAYYDNVEDIVYEEFIFHVDFKECVIAQDMEDIVLLIEMQDTSTNTIIDVLTEQAEEMIYNVYINKEAYIDVNASISNSTVYLGNNVDINVDTKFMQQNIGFNIIHDTKFFKEQLGIKISIYDHNNNKLEAEDLLGIRFILDGDIYYPRVDGTTRIRIADKVANVLTRLTMDTSGNTTLATGEYTIKVEVFSSLDGILYGTEVPVPTEIPFTVINNVYGLKVTTEDESKIVDKITGNTLNDTNALQAVIEYSSGLANPNIVVALERRRYDTLYSTNYELVDLRDYVLGRLTNGHGDYEYMVTNEPEGTNLFPITLAEGLKTGTYRLVFRLYDGTEYIGEAYDYIVIK